MNPEMVAHRKSSKASSASSSTASVSYDEESNEELNRTEEVEMTEALLSSSATLSTADSEEEPIDKEEDTNWLRSAMDKNPEFFIQGMKLAFCFLGLQASYLTWGLMQELIMTSNFEPTKLTPDGKFPSPAFCVFSNRFLAVIVAIIAVRIKHGAVLRNNTAPLWAFTPAAVSNTISSWSQYASLRYVSFPVQTVFKSSKIIAVMIMGKILKGSTYPYTQYVEVFLITCGVAVFSMAVKSPDDAGETSLAGLVFLLLFITFDSFTSQWQDKVYSDYGRTKVDPYQMMLGVNSSAIVITTVGLIVSGEVPVVWEFLTVNPLAFIYNILTAITSASGQLFIFYTIQEFGPMVFTIMMTIRQMISVFISAVVFKHVITGGAYIGVAMVFGVLFYQSYRKYSTASPSVSK